MFIWCLHQHLTSFSCNNPISPHFCVCVKAVTDFHAIYSLLSSPSGLLWAVSLPLLCLTCLLCDLGLNLSNRLSTQLFSPQDDYSSCSVHSLWYVLATSVYVCIALSYLSTVLFSLVLSVCLSEACMCVWQSRVENKHYFHYVFCSLC